MVQHTYLTYCVFTECVSPPTPPVSCPLPRSGGVLFSDLHAPHQPKTNTRHLEAAHSLFVWRTGWAVTKDVKFRHCYTVAFASSLSPCRLWTLCNSGIRVWWCRKLKGKCRKIIASAPVWFLEVKEGAELGYSFWPQASVTQYSCHSLAPTVASLVGLPLAETQAVYLGGDLDVGRRAGRARSHSVPCNRGPMEWHNHVSSKKELVSQFFPCNEDYLCVLL